MFSENDLQQFASLGIDVQVVEKQIENFKNGFPYMKIVEAATIGNGILQSDDSSLQESIAHFEEKLASKKVVKFVPASGAASRMFKKLFAFMESYKGSDSDKEELNSDTSFGSVYNVIHRIKDFAFYTDLKAAMSDDGLSMDDALAAEDYATLMHYILTDKGLDYGSLPKGLLKFHNYDNTNRTPVEEHLVEGANYCKDQDGNVRLHFTVSPEHEEKFKTHLGEVMEKYSSEFGANFAIDFSQQKKSTDTIAVDLENQPFRNSTGEILFRPGGHGALLENLNEIDADIIFIKNIDNVVPDKLKAETYNYKKALAGILLKYQTQIFDYIKVLDNSVEESKISEIKNFLASTLCTKLTDNFASLTLEEQANYLKSKLNRPIKVCGMVKNEGEPGGGPFWCKNQDATVSLQIVESAQINLDDSEQKEILQNATHFNPVDLICGVKDFKGNKFDLLEFRDPSTGFIAQKSKDGKDLKAQELPGLWNGAMSDWNTIFVEVPIVTFNPVKTVNDLLRDQHQ